MVTLREELKAAREKEAKAHGEAETARKEAEMAREKEAKARTEVEMARREAEAAQGDTSDKTPSGCCSMF